MFTPSIRAAVFAHALSCWVEGTAQVRSYLLSPPQHALELGASSSSTVETDDNNTVETLYTRTWRWLVAPGAYLDDTDGMLMGAVQMTTALLLLKAIRVRPLMPLLLTPILAAAAMPIPPASLLVSRGLRPGQMALVVFLMAVLHEAQRAGVSTTSIIARERQKELAGTIVVSGVPVVIDEDDDDELECIICAAPAHIPRPRSLSSESLASLASSSAVSHANPALGPLESFCTTAPQKHVAHRECFLAWRSAYAQSHAPHAIAVISESSTAARNEQLLSTSRNLLSRAGLLPLSPVVIAGHTDAVLLLDPGAHSGTLTSTCPPCPLCRSRTSVIVRTLPPESDTIAPPSLWRILYTFSRQWSRLVSPRTVAARVLGQGAFLWALLGVMRVREEVRQRVVQARGPG